MTKPRNNYLNQNSPSKNKWIQDYSTDSDKEYFSGANVNVYFGDVWMEEISNIEFSLQEQVAPIYGFHSYTWDRIARGNRFVSGSFTLNFTENGYLQTVLDNLTEKVNKNNNVLDGYGNGSEYYIDSKRTAQTIKTLTNESKGENYKSYINSLQKNYWGETSKSNVSNVGLSKDENPFWYGRQHGKDKNNPLRENGFNILIDYNPEMNGNDFENCLKNMGTGISAYNTFRTIIGVHIMSNQQVVGNDGQPIQERFTFIARDLDGDIQSGSLRYNFRNDLIGYDFDTSEYNKSKEPVKYPTTARPIPLDDGPVKNKTNNYRPKANNDGIIIGANAIR